MHSENAVHSCRCIQPTHPPCSTLVHLSKVVPRNSGSKLILSTSVLKWGWRSHSSLNIFSGIREGFIVNLIGLTSPSSDTLTIPRVMDKYLAKSFSDSPSTAIFRCVCSVPKLPGLLLRMRSQHARPVMSPRALIKWLLSLARFSRDQSTMFLYSFTLQKASCIVQVS